MYYKNSYYFIKVQCFISYKICISNNQPCRIRPKSINGDYIEFIYYQYLVNVNKSDGIYNNL